MSCTKTKLTTVEQFMLKKCHCTILSVPEAEIVRVTLTIQVGNSYLKLVVSARLLAAVLRRGGTLLYHLTAAQNLTQCVFFS